MHNCKASSMLYTLIEKLSDQNRNCQRNMYVASINLPLADEMKVLGVLLNRHLTFEKHISSVALS